MAVSMNTSSTAARSDMLLSDAMLPQRLAELDKKQMMQFAAILNGVGGEENVEAQGGTAGGIPAAEQLTGADSIADLQRYIDELRDAEKFEEFSKAVEELSNELKQRIACAEDDSEVFVTKDGRAVPRDFDQLAEMVARGELDIDDIPPDLVTDELLKEIAAKMLELMLHGELDHEKPKDEELFNPAVAAVNERDRVKELDGEILSELYKIVEKQNEKENEKSGFFGVFGEQADDVLPSIATEDIHAEQKTQEGVLEQVIDSMVESVAEEAAEAVNAVEAQPENTAASIVNAAVDEAVSEELTDAQTAVRADVKSDGTNTVKTGQTQSAEFDGVIKSELDKAVVEISGKAEKPAASEVQGEPESARMPLDPAERVKNASEEFEMLKSAKRAKANSDEEPLFKLQEKPTQTAAPLGETVEFTRLDGSKLEIKAADVVEQAAKLIEQAIAENKEQAEYSLTLNPEELGKITVKLIKAADGAISVTIAAENTRTQRILEQNSDIMQNNLRSNGVNLESWQTVRESQQETLAQDYNGSSKNPYYRHDNPRQEENPDEKSFADIIASM